MPLTFKSQELQEKESSLRTDAENSKADLFQVGLYYWHTLGYLH